MSSFSDITEEYSKNYSDISDMKSMYFRRRLEIVSQLVGTLNPGSLLDLGCGSGEVTAEIGKLMPNVEITLVDESLGMLKIAEENLKALQIDPQVIQASLEKTLIFTQKEVILLIGIVAYIENMEAVVNTCKICAMKSKTKVIIQITDMYHPLHLAARFIYRIFKGDKRSKLHYTNLKQRSMKALDSAMCAGEFKRTNTKRYGFDMPGVMDLKIPLFTNKFARMVDRLVGTDLICTYETMN